MVKRLRWNLFCKVVDNFGDAGVTLRLAKCLTHDYQQKVRIIVDRVDVLRMLWPEIAETDEAQEVQGIQVRGWKGWEYLKLGDVIVEMFGCNLPEPLVARLAFNQAAPLWINLEHLSAEPWVQTHHLLKSPHPGDTESVYFYPGFTNKTGGVLRERGLLSHRGKYLSRASLRAITFGAMGIHEPVAHGLVVLLFCYRHSELERWLQSLSEQSIPITLLVPPGPAREIACEWLNAILPPRSIMVRGSVTVCALPMVPQSRFDELLWCSDVAIVRGEDSFVRAQLAGVPFIWHAYPQSDGSHLKKMNAFLDIYLHGVSEERAQIVREMWGAWNRDQPLTEAWTNMLVSGDFLHDHAQEWMNSLAAQPSLAQQLLSLALKNVKSTTLPAKKST